MDNNLRRAYVQEQLGVYLLRSVAAVAEVERPQDYGVDAIVTLLRPENRRYLLANATFYVQLKSATVSNIGYKGDSLCWLKNLRIPMFIGSVDSKKMTLSLYTSHRAFLALTSWDYKEIVIHLHENPNSQNDSEKWCVEKSSNCTEKTADVYLGNPVYELSPKDLSDETILTDFCDVLEPMLAILQRNIQWQPIGYSELFRWNTGKPPELSGWNFSTQVSRHLGTLPPIHSARQFSDEIYFRGLPILLKELEPYLKAWALYALSNDQQDEWFKIEPFLDLLHEKSAISNDVWRSIKALATQKSNGSQQCSPPNRLTPSAPAVGGC